MNAESFSILERIDVGETMSSLKQEMGESATGEKKYHHQMLESNTLACRLLRLVQ